MDNDKPKKSGWRTANIIILALSVVSAPIAAFWFITVPGFSFYFFVALLILFILIPIFFIINRKIGKCRIALWTARIAFVLMGLLYAALPYIGINFEHNKAFYNPKKIIYTYGVYSSPYTITEMLPKHLPDECRDYKFKTQLGSIAQDYHPSVYLMFYTDSDTIAEYESFLKEFPNCVRSDETDEYDYGRYSGKYVYPKDFPTHAFAWLDDTHKEEFLDMRNAVVYAEYGRGCLLDHDSGLVVYWT